MAISDFFVGNGQYALAYGQHVAAGILAGVDKSNPSAVKLKVLLGLGEWDSIVEISYDGTVIDAANYTFHPGTLSTGTADALQGEDSRFPSGIYHSRIAYYSVTLPDGLGAEDRPDKMRVIAKCLKINRYNPNGTVNTYAYSTNPADVFADLVRRNCLRNGLVFVDHVDWDAYIKARDFYSITKAVDDGIRTPLNFAAGPGGSGSLAAGTWWFRLSAIKSGGITESAAASPQSESVAASGQVALSWDAVGEADGYRLYYGQDTSDVDHYIDVGNVLTYNFASASGSTGTPKEVPTGEWQHLEEHLQCQRAFTQTEILTGDALSAVMFDAASDWVRDGKKYRILLPNQTTSSHRLTVDNTTDSQYQHVKTPIRDRANRITAAYRNLFNNMKPEETIAGNDLALQARTGIVNEPISLGSMNSDQMRRISRWRFHEQHELPRRMRVTGQGDSAHLLAGDVLTVADRQGGKRNAHGVLADAAGIVFSSLNNIVAYSGADIKFDEPTPRARTRSVKVYMVGSGGIPRWTSNMTTPLAVGTGAGILTYVKVSHGSNVSEVTVQLINSSTGARRIVSLRRPQTASSITPDGNDVMTRSDLPPSGRGSRSTWTSRVRRGSRSIRSELRQSGRPGRSTSASSSTSRTPGSSTASARSRTRILTEQVSGFSRSPSTTIPHTTSTTAGCSPATM
jgi:hypothetical protein